VNERYFQIFQNGMADQFKELNLDEMVLYLRNHIHNFLLDETICFCFIERFANDPEIGRHERARKSLFYLLDKAVQLRPFRPGLLKAVARMTGNLQVQSRLEVVEKLNEDKEIYDQIVGLDLKHDAEDARQFLGQLISAHQRHVAAAQFALHVDHYLGLTPGPWLNHFKCPRKFKEDWDILLFNHYASLAAFEQAMSLWPALDQSRMRETTYNLAAEMFVDAGEVGQAIDFYKASLRQDGRQTPVRLRLRQLENPFTPDPGLLDTCRVDICVYSWNKADMLGQTLKSLSKTDIGQARINILLNGCTDHSREVVDKAVSLFPDNEVTIHDLHVNIGAPAARNWLMRLPDVRQSDYIAFIDDDIIMQRDWLAQFLTVAESDSRIGAVGCKIVNPTSPRLYQYLFRYVAMACHGLLKLSIPAPPDQFDNGLYNFVRETRNVMGCQHLLRTSALDDIPAGFDIRFSPSQVDDMDHDIALCLKGYRVMYCGTVTCEHHQGSGVALIKAQEWEPNRVGNAMGNDLKFYFKHYNQMNEVEKLDNLSIPLGVELPEI